MVEITANRCVETCQTRPFSCYDNLRGVWMTNSRYHRSEFLPGFNTVSYDIFINKLRKWGLDENIR